MNTIMRTIAGALGSQLIVASAAIPGRRQEERALARAGRGA
jgi:hypothetical protein